MIAVREARPGEILEAANAAALLEEYAGECSLEEMGRICPQAKLYEAMQASGHFRCFGVWDGGELCGFATVLDYVNPHYGKNIATVESLFVAAAHRRMGTGNALMNAIEDHARALGCVVVLYSAPAGSQLERLLTLLHPYRHSNTVFLRKL